MAWCSNIRNDFDSHGRDPLRQGFWVMCVYRFGRWRYGVRPGWLRKVFSLAYKLLYKVIQILTGVELPCEAVVGHNFRIDHFGGIIVSGYAVFGDNCVLRQGVTVGLKNTDDPQAPRIGNNVSIGAGAKLLGPIVIGDNVDIGANAVVVRDVPANHIAVGVPARNIPKPNADAGNSHAR